MPKIDAPTVREHHEAVKARLVAATERILRESGHEALSAGAVAREAGIARNSIYRYVDSVDDLRLLALARHLPRWREAVFARVDPDADAAERLRQFADACVVETREPSHSWYVSLTRHSSARRRKSPAKPAAVESGGNARAGGSAGGAVHAERKSPSERRQAERAAIRSDVVDIHATVDGFLLECWKEMGVDDPSTWMGFSRALLLEAFAQVESGADVHAVADRVSAAVRGMTKAACDAAC